MGAVMQVTKSCVWRARTSASGVKNRCLVTPFVAKRKTEFEDDRILGPTYTCSKGAQGSRGGLQFLANATAELEMLYSVES